MSQYIQQFKQHWVQFQQRHQLDSQRAEQCYAQLAQAYLEPQRHYHTVQHIVECLDLFHQVKAQLSDPFAVELAIWFHDVVYNPKASDNEAQSAVFMQQCCHDFVPVAVLEKIAAWIEATQQHQPSTDTDLNFLLDIDLAILASSPSRFAEYETQIQQEYHWVEAIVYKEKRAAVLRYFYAMQPLYQTAYFQEKYELQAKQNLSLSLCK